MRTNSTTELTNWWNSYANSTMAVLSSGSGPFHRGTSMEYILANKPFTFPFSTRSPSRELTHGSLIRGYLFVDVSIGDESLSEGAGSGGGAAPAGRLLDQLGQPLSSGSRSNHRTSVG
ncbi:hypothetical protein [Arthrobacter agilis]|uniref:hypothetical protein n=1 Tax=Arthrobacter agilis TaxID=37921 RepID=UPI001ABF977B